MTELKKCKILIVDDVSHNIHIQDGILVVDNQGIVCFANPAAAQMFNRPLSNLVGQDIGIPLVFNKTVDIQILRPNGNLGIAEVTVGHGKWQGEPVSIVCLRDVSDRTS